MRTDRRRVRVDQISSRSGQQQLNLGRLRWKRLELPKFPGFVTNSESIDEVTYIAASDLIAVLDRKSTGYWKKRGVL